MFKNVEENMNMRTREMEGIKKQVNFLDETDMIRNEK